MSRHHRSSYLSLLAIPALALAACAVNPGEGAPPQSPAAIAKATFTPRAPDPTPTPGKITIWLSPALPDALRQPFLGLTQVAGRTIEFVTDRSTASVRAEAATSTPLSTWIYAVVAPFPTIADSIGLADLRGEWSGAIANNGLIYATASTADAMQPILGRNADAGTSIVDPTQMIAEAWQSRPSMAIVPFESLEPRWKVLALDGQSPLDKSFTPENYGLVVRYGLTGDPASVDAVRGAIDWPSTNRDPSKMTIVIMTGTTALTRATAWQMQENGISYPGLKIGDWLREADVTHVSNEVAFTPKCPPPDPSQDSLIFCSPAEDIGLLDQVGVHLVELTGNHVLDWGPDALSYTLDLYRQRGWEIFGGGANLAESMKPALIEHNGNKLAFLGCNEAGPQDDWASETAPGSTPCDYTQLFSEMQALKSQGYVTIFTFQWSEYYRASPPPEQVAGFHRAVDAGAMIVSGSQAHEPMGFEFYGGAFIHYGPGNLFFDQMFSSATRQEFLDRYVIYAGRHISTQLLTAYLENFAQPRPMTSDERGAFLARMFAASGW